MLVVAVKLALVGVVAAAAADVGLGAGVGLVGGANLATRWVKCGAKR